MADRFQFCFCLLAGLLVMPHDGSAADERLQGRLSEAVAAGQLPGLHSALVILKDEVLAEVHTSARDERWGQPLGRRQHGPKTLHDLRSVTKSIVGLLYGIALDEGLVPGLDDPLLDQFPEYADLASDPGRRRILVRHALSMTMGTQWNEDLPYSDPANSEIAMERSADRYRFVLDRPMVGEPGASWIYSGGATAIVARLIARGAGVPIATYARDKLFAPLGIDDFEWVAGPDGEQSAASGLRLTVHDLARIGRLIVDKGAWQGRPVVPAEWVEAMLSPQVTATDGLRYGFFWWLAPDGTPPYWVAAFGNGGQRLMVAPRSGLIVVVFAGNYNQPDAWKLPVRIITEFAVPAIRDR